MISVSVEVDIRRAMEMLNLLPKEADRAASRAINKLADEVLKASAENIARKSGMDLGSRAEAKAGGGRNTVYGRMWVRGANPNYLKAEIGTLPSAQNVGYYPGANPRPGAAVSSHHVGGLSIRAWGRGNFYDRTFVKGKQWSVGVRRKVFKRTGPKPEDIDGRVWGPSVGKMFAKPDVQALSREIIQKRWPYWFERYLRAEIVRLRGADALKGVKNVAPFIGAPTDSP
jgi:hypothetical protein